MISHIQKVMAVLTLVKNQKQNNAKQQCQAKLEEHETLSQYIPNQGYVRLQPQLQSNHVYITLLSTPVFCDSTTSTAAFGHNNLGPRFFQFSDDPAFICWQSGSRRNRDYYVTTTDSTMFSASLIDATQWSQREIRVWSVELHDGNWKADLQCVYTRKVHDRNIIPLGISPGFSMTLPLPLPP